MADALAAYQQAVKRGQELHLPWTPYAIVARAMVATVYYIQGDWLQVERVITTSSLSSAI